MAVTNLKLVAGGADTYIADMAGYSIVQLTPPVTNDSPYYMHLNLIGGVGSAMYLLTGDDITNVTAHVVPPGIVKTFGPFQADTAPYGIAISDAGSPGSYTWDFTVFQSGGNKQAPVLISRDSVVIDVTDGLEAYQPLITFWDSDTYPGAAPTNLTCAVYVVIYAEDIDWLSVVGTGVTTGGANSAMIVNRGESLVIGPFTRENMPTIYTPESAGIQLRFSLDVVKREA